jgi:very-short-patch-repair endonuclease
MSDFVIALLVLVLVLVAGLALAKATGLGRPLPVRARRLMTPREREVIVLIEAAVPTCRVHAQVAMGAIINCNRGLARNQRTSVRNTFDRKVIDFVLEDRATGDVLALVELDDRTHNEGKDRARDEITKAAGYRTVRLRAGKRLDPRIIRDEIVAVLPRAEPVKCARI